VHDGILIEEFDGGHETFLELLLGGDADVAQDGAGELGEEAFDQIEPGAVLGSEGESESVGALLGKPSPRLSGDVRGMIVEDQVDRRVGRVCGVEQLEEVDELAAAMTILDQGVDFAGQQVDAGHQCHGAVALVFVVACEGRMHAGLRRQIGRCRGERLDAGLLVVGDDGDRLARLLVVEGALLQKLHLAIEGMSEVLCKRFL
jgi:hypothetical protein